LSSAASAQTYTYDVYGRVTAVAQPNGASSSYTYDSVDNRTAASVTLPGGGTVTINVTAASNLRTLANNAGYTGASGVSYQFVVPSGTTIMGSSSGGSGIDTGTWLSGVTLTLVVSGNVYGGGGSGGGGAVSAGGAGGNGGDAVYVQAPIGITINSGGAVEGGGGGGGGGGGQINTKLALTWGGGGGGGGFPNGAAGPGTPVSDYPGSDGSTGTTSGGGAGGAGGAPAGNGGNGGGAAASGSAGVADGIHAGGAPGAGGYAIRKNGNTVTVTNNGTELGTIG
jgi:YD repeat-containing protein